MEDKDKLNQILINEIANNITVLIKGFNEWGYRKKLDYYFYKLIIQKRTEFTLKELLKDKVNNEFIVLIYSTLISWDMAIRNAKIRNYKEFEGMLINQRENIIDLSDFKLNELTEANIEIVKLKLKSLYKGLDLMESNPRIVSNSKTLHFLLPELIIPIDSRNIMRYFSVYENHKNSLDPRSFLRIFQYSWRIAQKIKSADLIDNKWNPTIPKIIDNAIIYYMLQKEYQQNYIKGFKEKLQEEKFSVPKELVIKLQQELEEIISEEQNTLKTFKI